MFDSTGSEKYRLVCKEQNIVPISRVLKSLGTEELNLKVSNIKLIRCRIIKRHVECIIYTRDVSKKPTSVMKTGYLQIFYHDCSYLFLFMFTVPKAQKILKN